MNIISIGLVLLAWGPAANLEDRRGDPPLRERAFLDFGAQLNDHARPTTLQDRLQDAHPAPRLQPNTPLSRALGEDQLMR